MEMTVGALADYANRTDDGKLNIIGAFDRVVSAQFPFTLAEMFVIVHLRQDAGETRGQRDLQIELFGPDGRAVLSIRRGFEAGAGDGTPAGSIHSLVRLKGTVFPRPGQYEFVVRVDDARVGAIPIEAALRSPVAIS